MMANCTDLHHQNPVSGRAQECHISRADTHDALASNLQCRWLDSTLRVSVLARPSRRNRHHALSHRSHEMSLVQTCSKIDVVYKSEIWKTLQRRRISTKMDSPKERRM